MEREFVLSPCKVVGLKNVGLHLTSNYRSRGYDLICVFPFQKMSDKCFKKCITKPGTSLDNSETVSVDEVLFILLHILLQ